MSHTLPLNQASAQLSAMVRALGPGDVIVLTDNDIPIARIVANPSRHNRVPGAWRGMLTVLKEDEEHLEDFKEYMP